MSLIGEPNLREYTEDEVLEMAVRSGLLLEEGKEAEAAKAIADIPLTPDAAQALKEIYGMSWLIEHNVNLSVAVKKYGKDWLNS